MIIVGRTKEEATARSKAIRKDFQKRYNLDELRQELFDKQSGLCAICRQPLQDVSSVITAIDHATSVATHAQYRWPIEETIEVCNSKKNLVAVHNVCNYAKHAWDLDEFTERLESGEITVGFVEVVTSEKIQQIKEQMIEKSRKGGRSNAEHRTGFCSRTREKMSEDGRKSGRISACRNKERGTGLYGLTFEQRSSVGVKNGRAVFNKGVGVFARSPEQHAKDSRKAAAATHAVRTHEESVAIGRRAGAASLASRTPEQRIRWSRDANHKNWHIDRSRYNPRCVLCSEQSLVIAWG
jgi:hypothetical protein